MQVPPKTWLGHILRWITKDKRNKTANERDNYGKQKMAIESMDDKFKGDSIKQQTKDMMLLFISIAMFGLSVVFTHILSYVESEGVSPSLGTVLVSALGAANFAGRFGLEQQQQLLLLLLLLLCRTVVFNSYFPRHVYSIAGSLDFACWFDDLHLWIWYISSGVRTYGCGMCVFDRRAQTV